MSSFEALQASLSASGVNTQDQIKYLMKRRVECKSRLNGLATELQDVRKRRQKLERLLRDLEHDIREYASQDFSTRSRDLSDPFTVPIRTAPPNVYSDIARKRNLRKVIESLIGQEEAKAEVARREALDRFTKDHPDLKNLLLARLGDKLSLADRCSSPPPTAMDTHNNDPMRRTSEVDLGTESKHEEARAEGEGAFGQSGLSSSLYPFMELAKSTNGGASVDLSLSFSSEAPPTAVPVATSSQASCPEDVNGGSANLNGISPTSSLSLSTANTPISPNVSESKKLDGDDDSNSQPLGPLFGVPPTIQLHSKTVVGGTKTTSAAAGNVMPVAGGSEVSVSGAVVAEEPMGGPSAFFAQQPLQSGPLPSMPSMHAPSVPPPTVQQQQPLFPLFSPNATPHDTLQLQPSAMTNFASGGMPLQQQPTFSSPAGEFLSPPQPSPAFPFGGVIAPQTPTSAFLLSPDGPTLSPQPQPQPPSLFTPFVGLQQLQQLQHQPTPSVEAPSIASFDEPQRPAPTTPVSRTTPFDSLPQPAGSVEGASRGQQSGDGTQSPKRVSSAFSGSLKFGSPDGQASAGASEIPNRLEPFSTPPTRSDSTIFNPTRTTQSPGGSGVGNIVQPAGPWDLDMFDRPPPPQSNPRKVAVWEKARQALLRNIVSQPLPPPEQPETDREASSRGDGASAATTPSKGAGDDSRGRSDQKLDPSARSSSKESIKSKLSALKKMLTREVELVEKERSRVFQKLPKFFEDVAVVGVSAAQGAVFQWSVSLQWHPLNPFQLPAEKLQPEDPRKKLPQVYYIQDEGYTPFFFVDLDSAVYHVGDKPATNTPPNELPFTGTPILCQAKMPNMHCVRKATFKSGRFDPLFATFLLSSVCERIEVTKVPLPFSKLCVVLAKVPKHKTLRELVLTHADMRDTEMGALAAAVGESETLAKLDVSNNMITAKSAQAIKKMLQATGTLEELILDSNKLGDEGVTAFSDCTARHPSLRLLSLAKNGITSHGMKLWRDGVDKCYALSVKRPPPFAIRSLSPSPMERKSSQGPSAPPPPPSLPSLSDHLDKISKPASENSDGRYTSPLPRVAPIMRTTTPMKPRGASPLPGAGDRRSTTPLRPASSSGPPPPPVVPNAPDAAPFELVINKDSALPLPTEKQPPLSLNLCGNDVKNEGVAEVCWVMANRRLSCVGLDLSGNGVGDDGAVTLAKFLESDTSLATLRLNDNLISDVGARDFSKSLRVNKTLQDLELDGNHITLIGASLLQSKLPDSFWFTEFQLDQTPHQEKPAPPSRTPPAPPEDSGVGLAVD